MMIAMQCMFWSNEHESEGLESGRLARECDDSCSAEVVPPAAFLPARPMLLVDHQGEDHYSSYMGDTELDLVVEVIG
jgi:hypothetical protein